MKAAVPTRAEALATLEDGDTRIQQLVNAVPRAELTRPATIGGSGWSAKDLIGHLATWEELALETISALRAGRKPSVAEFGRGGGDRLNAEMVERKRPLSLDEVRTQAKATHQRLLAELRGMSEEEWMGSVAYRTDQQAPVATILGSVLGGKRPFGHAFDHLADLEAHVTSLSKQ